MQAMKKGRGEEQREGDEQAQAERCLDVVIVGAGPHALAFVCRLLEAKPDSVYDERDLTTRQKYHPELSRKKSRGRRAVDGSEGEKKRSKPAIEFVAVDESGGWMRRWDDMMHNLDVKHLRSPLNAHPDPFDVTSLNAYAHEQQRVEELKCLGLGPGTSGREDKKKIRDHSAHIFASNDRIMLKVPSVPLFKSFCQTLVKRYSLDSHLIKAKVINIEPCFDQSSSTVGLSKPSSFRVHLSTGLILHTKRVILATGQTQPRIPSWVPRASLQSNGTIVHSDHINVNDRRRINGKRILIVGGGITSYHLTRSALLAGASKITMVTRRYIKVQHFDVSLHWAGRYKKVHYSKFYALDDPTERYGMLQEARGEGGGTMPPHMHSYLKEMHGWKSGGKFVLAEKVEVAHLEWIPVNQACSAQDDASAGDEGDYWCVRLSNNQVLHVDHIWLATGRELDAEKEPLMKELLRYRPIPLVNGLPVLQSTLRWSEDWDVFVLGAYAALQLGPDAINLAGARAGSMRAYDALIAGDESGKDELTREVWSCREEDLNPYSLLNESYE